MWGFEFKMRTWWLVLSVFVLCLIFLNNLAQNYFNVVMSGRRTRKIIAATVKTVVPLLAYMGIVSCIYFANNRFRKTIVLHVSSVEAFDLSSSTDVFDEAHVAKRAVRFFANLDFFHCFLVPFVLLCKLAFSVVGGTGLALLPINLIFIWVHRPKQRDPEDHVLGKKILRDMSEELIKHGRLAHDIQRDIDLNTTDDERELRMKSLNLKKRMLELKRDLIEFEEMYESFNEEDNIIDSNPLIYIGALVLGILLGLLSLLLIMHMILTVAGLYAALEAFFLWIARYNNITSMILFVIFALYLCLTVLYGATQLTFLSSYFLKTHPVRPGQTWTDTFLLNINLGLFGTFGMLIFLLDYCRKYLRFLDADTLFNKILSRAHVVHFLKKGLIFGYILMLCFLTTFFISFFLITSRATMHERVEKLKQTFKQDKDSIAAYEKGQTQAGDLTKLV